MSVEEMNQSKESSNHRERKKGGKNTRKMVQKVNQGGASYQPEFV